MALNVGAPILPVLMDCDPPAFTKTMRWYDVPPRAFCMKVAVLPAVSAARYVPPGAPAMLAARALTTGIETHITDHLLQYGFLEARN
jgi:hypothetical protein